MYDMTVIVSLSVAFSRYPPSDSPFDDDDTTDTDMAAGGGLRGMPYHQRKPAPPVAPSIVPSDLRGLQISIHEYRERNSVVARTINELHQEVSDTLEERIALEYQLEQLKSFGE